LSAEGKGTAENTRPPGRHPSLHSGQAPAAFWHSWLAQLEDDFISRVASDVVGVLQRLQTFRLTGR